MSADGRNFFRGFLRRLGVVYAKVEEIQEMMGRNFGVEFDEAELMDELNELDEELISD